LFFPGGGNKAGPVHEMIKVGSRANLCSVTFQACVSAFFIIINIYSKAASRILKLLKINTSRKMVSWESLIRFTADDSAEYWAALALDDTPKVGLQMEGFDSIEDLEGDKGGKKVVVKQV
jgi:hypothetical protein